MFRVPTEDLPHVEVRQLEWAVEDAGDEIDRLNAEADKLRNYVELVEAELARRAD